MWKKYRRKGITEMRPYIPGEDMEGISVSDGDTPEHGGMIARNMDKHTDQWYVSVGFQQKAEFEEVKE